MLKASKRDIRSYGITIYRIFGKKRDLEGQEKQLENHTILIDSSENDNRSFISFQGIGGIDTGILNEVWSHTDFEHYCDEIKAGYRLITLKRGDIIEFIGDHRIIEIDNSMIKKN